MSEGEKGSCLMIVCLLLVALMFALGLSGILEGVQVGGNAVTTSSVSLRETSNPESAVVCRLPSGVVGSILDKEAFKLGGGGESFDFFLFESKDCKGWVSSTSIKNY